MFADDSGIKRTTPAEAARERSLRLPSSRVSTSVECQYRFLPKINVKCVYWGLLVVWNFSFGVVSPWRDSCRLRASQLCRQRPETGRSSLRKCGLRNNGLHKEGMTGIHGMCGMWMLKPWVFHPFFWVQQTRNIKSHDNLRLLGRSTNLLNSPQGFPIFNWLVVRRGMMVFHDLWSKQHSSAVSLHQGHLSTVPLNLRLC